jgi:HAD superfamily phosphoserine phosphatase-like hydrolase
MHRLAIYDMDRTLTRVATFTPFLFYATRRLAPWRFVLLPAVALVSIAYLMRLIDRARLKEINQRLMLGPHLDPAELAPLVAGFAAQTVATNVYHQAIDRLAADRAEGYRLVLATASYRLYAAAIGDALGFDDVIATNSMIGLDARVRPRIDGENCYGPAKLRMIEAWMAAQPIARGDAHVRFYSDHASDAPVLEWADEGFAVNAHDRLLRLARSRGWEIIDWR